MIGGALARPCISYPDLFPRGTIWDRYPYLLPNLFSAVMVFIGVTIGLLFLEETHVEKKLQKDRGRELGNQIRRLFQRATVCKYRVRSAEKQALLADDGLAGYSTAGVRPRAGDAAAGMDEPLPAYQSQENSPKLAPQRSFRTRRQDAQHPPTRAETVEGRKPKVFTKPVMLNIVSYGILALYVSHLYPRCDGR